MLIYKNGSYSLYAHSDWIQNYLNDLVPRMYFHNSFDNDDYREFIALLSHSSQHMEHALAVIKKEFKCSQDQAYFLTRRVYQDIIDYHGNRGARNKV